MTTHVPTAQAAPARPVPARVEFARWYAQRGWRVLPLHHVEDGRCSCGNPKEDPNHDYRQGGKHPVHAAWQDNATTDQKQIAAWWAQRPNANIGIATGEASGIFVLDVDPDSGGFDSLAALQKQHGDLPETRRHQTGSGGLHFLFRWPGFNPRNSAGKLGAGLDIRADGGQVVAPPSVSAKGPYAPGGGPEPVDAPEWLLALLRPALPRPAPPPGSFVAPVGNQDAYTRRAVQAECDAIIHAADGEQNHTINRAAYNVGTLVARAALTEAEAREALLAAAHAGNHPEGRAVATIDSGLRAGMAQPRQPWPPVARADTRNDFTGLLLPEPRTAPPAPAPIEHEQPSENPMQARLAELRAALVDSAGLDSIADPVPLIDGVLYMDSLAWLYGKPGSAKSFVALDWAGCIGSGLPWQLRGVSQGPVLYLVAEGASGIRKRVRSWEEAFRTPMQNVIFLPMAVQLLNGVDRQALVALIKEMAPSLVIIDTQARVTVGADENSNGEMSKVVDAADQIRQACGACVLMVHHSGKSGLDMRGASAFEGAATSIIKVTKDGEYVEIHSDKQKDEDAFETVWLRLTPVGQSVVLVARSVMPGGDEMTKNEETILAAMRDSFETTSATATNLIEVTDVPKASVYRALNSLVNRGSLRNIGTEKRPIYALPSTDRGAA
ncbi:bifunctional DNA primase/polymerase [Streptomyces sp. NPDC054987]